jgi:hypothetical protein
VRRLFETTLPHNKDREGRVRGYFDPARYVREEKYPSINPFIRGIGPLFLKDRR